MFAYERQLLSLLFNAVMELKEDHEANLLELASYDARITAQERKCRRAKTSPSKALVNEKLSFEKKADAVVRDELRSVGSIYLSARATTELEIRAAEIVNLLPDELNPFKSEGASRTWQT